MGSPPRDEEFLNRLEALEENALLVYDLPDPDVHIKGLSQHPLQKVAQNQADHKSKKFHTFKWLGKLYVVRLPVPNQEALDTKTPTTSPANEP